MHEDSLEMKQENREHTSYAQLSHQNSLIQCRQGQLLEVFYSEDGETREQVTQKSCEYPIPGNNQDLDGWSKLV